MLNFRHMTLEVLGEAALPVPVTEDPFALRRRGSFRVEAHEYLPVGGSSTVTGGRTRHRDLVAGTRLSGVAEELEARGSHRSRKNWRPRAAPERCRHLVGTVVSGPGIRLHRRLHELRLDRESGCEE
jgi:hypothetical protein